MKHGSKATFGSLFKKGSIHSENCNSSTFPILLLELDHISRKIKLNSKQQISFWAIVFIVLIMLFGSSLDGWVIAFYFVSFLFPVIIGTSYVFNRWLVPTYLLQGRRIKFSLYFIYLLIVSIYLELLVMILAFVILADYKIENLGKIVSDIYLMAIIMYLIVFANGFVLIVKQLKSERYQTQILRKNLEKDQTDYLLVRIDRKNTQIKTSVITYIESLSDYVQIHTTEETLITKEKISSLETLLPTWFIRIHRSFIVNRVHVQSFNAETVELADIKLPIGRKYKNDVLEKLRS